MSHHDMPGHEAVRRWFEGALRVVDPRSAVVNAMSLDDDVVRIGTDAVPLSAEGRLVVLVIGKAAAGMAEGAREVLGDRIDRGIVLTKYGHLDRAVEGFEVYEAGHPVPDEQGLAATRNILDAVQGLSSRDCVIALISGGGSALLELPREGLSLEDMQGVTSRLMHAGAGIHDLNTVRKALSHVKGGGLRRAIGPARCVTLLLSDVLGNDPSVIASGPTVMSSSTVDEARRMVERYGISDQVGDAIRDTLGQDRPDETTADTSDDLVTVIADNAMLIREVARLAGEDELAVQRDDEPYDGDAALLGRDMVRRVRDTAPDVDVIVRGGEATVTVTGDGTGGRNTEMVLAAAIELTSADEWIVASLASDGDDGNSGATGAVADAQTVERAQRLGIDPAKALDRNDSATVFREAGGLVVTGPTGTNVNDVYVAMRRAHHPGELETA